MRKFRNLLLIPVALSPYTVLAALYLILSNSPIIKYVFQNNGLLLVGAVFTFAVIALVLAVVYFAAAMKAGWDSLSLAKAAMIVKLIHIPAYVVIFALGLIFLLTIFTFAISIVFILLDCLAITMTGLLGTAAAAAAAREKKLSSSKAVLWSVLQFLFCIDIAASVLLYRKLKNL